MKPDCVQNDGHLSLRMVLAFVKCLKIFSWLHVIHVSLLPCKLFLSFMKQQYKNVFPIT